MRLQEERNLFFRFIKCGYFIQVNDFVFHFYFLNKSYVRNSLTVCAKALVEGRPRAERVGSQSTALVRGLGSSVQPENAKAESSPLGEDVRRTEEVISSQHYRDALLGVWCCARYIALIQNTASSLTIFYA